MTEKDYFKVVDAMDEAQESDRPYLIHEEEPIVVGDANETEVTPTDFKVLFRIPKKENNKVTYEYREIEYNDVYITPRMDMKIVRVMSELTPFFRKVNEKGEVEKYTDDEAMKIVESLDDEILDHMYDLVGSVLRIDRRLVPFIELAAVLDNVTQIIHAFPEVYNESEAFFPPSSAEEQKSLN